jgi:hypothetical protein
VPKIPFFGRVLFQPTVLASVARSHNPTEPTDPIDWEALRSAAAAITSLGYAPYSLFPVGAAGLGR